MGFADGVLGSMWVHPLVAVCLRCVVQATEGDCGRRNGLSRGVFVTRGRVGGHPPLEAVSQPLAQAGADVSSLLRGPG